MSPFIHLAKCQFCGDENEHVQPVRQPDGSTWWTCEGDSAVIIACAMRKWPPPLTQFAGGPRLDTFSDGDE